MAWVRVSSPGKAAKSSYFAPSTYCFGGATGTARPCQRPLGSLTEVGRCSVVPPKFQMSARTCVYEYGGGVRGGSDGDIGGVNSGTG